MCLAVYTGLRCGNNITPVARRTRSVAAAMNAWATSGSGMASVAGKNASPLADPG